MRNLLASTCLAALAIAPAHAETTVADKRTAAIRTSTIKAGAADDIRITSAGSVEPTVAGAAVTIDSNHRVVNEGTILIGNQDNSIGIRAEAGRTGGITNASGGKITIDETYTPADADKDGDLDGPLAVGSGRFGIRTMGDFIGDVTNSGTITIEGRDSAGIQLGGTLDGKLIQDGTISVTGDRSVGVRLGNVTGGVQPPVVGQYSTAVRIAGTVTATGQGAVGVSAEGDINGALVIQGTVTATGYRSTTAPADTSKLDADDLLQGGPAVRIAGNVAGGVVFAVPPKDNSTTDNDEDKDGIEDSKEGSASVTSVGAAPAVEIGSATRAVTLGAVSGNADGHGLINEGNITGAGAYPGVNGNGMVIGGLGQAVTVAGGMTNKGNITATGATATALRVGAGATVPQLKNSGTIAATGANATNTRAVAIQIDSGAKLFELSNSGSIKAVGTGTVAADAASATAILDRSGELRLISNSGTISASGVAGASTAIDLGANTSGARIGQTQVASGIAAPSIVGDVRFGSGNDVFDIADGSMAGDTSFGAGANQLLLSGDATYAGRSFFGAGNDIVTLGGTSAYTGDIDLGGGADRLTLTGSARFRGSLLNAQGTAVAVTGGTLDIGRTTASIGSLSVGGGGTLVVSVDTATRTNTLYQVAGNASIDGGAKVVVRLSGVTGAEGSYTFVRAGSVTLPTTIAANRAVLPFMYKGTVSAKSATEIAVDVTRKTTTELGLNRSQARAYDAIYAALGKDAKVAGVYLEAADGNAFRRSVRQMLPDHAGGAFESVTMGSRATATFLADPNAPFADMGKWGYFIQQVGWGTSKGLGDTASYDVSGWGVSMGGEIKTDLGSFGLSLAYLYGKDADGGTDNKVDADNYEIGGYWRGYWGPLQGWTRVSWGHVRFKGSRVFSGALGTETVDRRAKGRWNGRLLSAAGGASYDWKLGGFTLRPKAAVDYYRLKEKGYAEAGGGDAFNLIVDGRSSDELALTGSVAAGFDFGGANEDSGWFRIEAEAGRRELVGGSLGSTTARFAGGTAFTLDPEQRTSGWVGKLRAVGGGAGFQIGGEAGAEQQQGRAALSLRASLVVGL
ncbi:autotransporter outer membrane beta-barrel domain-containing protein [Rhizorhabdus dicambivorans]|uniref:Autotransporter domain-containing protein n=1 Tax=Rhizorhabdus dicambivorans TaxID=1850238 RepID=A0A2A4FUF7_9SPHN|nr:autotransporter outer membrane beta-barrel domain-containing protein [Rhizorhabdus dicambivorans]ATE66477.1 autotransporter domain-containing protein [Rhizorhabdus dicambivorans]PCE41031.1 autotransporter domain-containing protein [Rhizorhabdus dicambivorans]